MTRLLCRLPHAIIPDMNVEQFEDTLRTFLRREPFEPFVVELVDGRTVEVDEPGVAFAGGAASFLTPAYELIEFTFDDVREIRHAKHGAAS